MELKPEQLLAKIGLLVMEVDVLRGELGKVQQGKVQCEKELAELKKGNEGAKAEKK